MPAALMFQTWLQHPSAGHSSSPYPTKPPSSLLGETPVHSGEPHSHECYIPHTPKTLPMVSTDLSKQGIAVCCSTELVGSATTALCLCPPPHMFTGTYISSLLIKCCSHMTSLTTR